MANSVIKIRRITLRDFKNVEYGELEIELTDTARRSSVVGIYGQNGSGKTAVIEALNLLKTLLEGGKANPSYVDYISLESEMSHLGFEFEVIRDDKVIRIWYEFSLGRTVREPIGHYANKATEMPWITDEVVSYSVLSQDGHVKEKKSIMIDTRNTSLFLPKSKYREIVGDTRREDIIVAKSLASHDSVSFVFSKSFMDIMNQNCKNDMYAFVLNRLKQFGIGELFVINTHNSGLISLNAQPINFNIVQDDRGNIGTIAVPSDGPVDIPLATYEISKRVVDNLNTVLPKLVPGITIELKMLSEIVLDDGTDGRRVQLISHRKSGDLPLKSESEGIRKIISVLQLLISIYNRPSVCVAIDELDSGVFEYLLGELTRIICDKGKGELIFTSHNLRPLETIDKKNIVFTTVNPRNRYTRIKYVKSNNNLRNVYFKEVLLGSDKDNLYDQTDNQEIALAFRKAGENDGEA